MARMPAEKTPRARPIRAAAPQPPEPPAAAPELPAPWASGLQFVEALQRIQREALREVGDDANLGLDEAARTRGPQDLAVLGVEYWATEWSRSARLAERLWAGMLDAQAASFRYAEAWTAGVLGLWLASEGPAPAEAPLDRFADFTPAGLLRAANATAQEVGKLWLGALVHDTQEAAA